MACMFMFIPFVFIYIFSFKCCFSLFMDMLRKYNLPVDGDFLFTEAGIRNIQNSLQGKLVYKQLVDENSCEI